MSGKGGGYVTADWFFRRAKELILEGKTFDCPQIKANDERKGSFDHKATYYVM